MAATIDCKRFANNKKDKPINNTILPDDYLLRYEKRLDKIEVWKKEGISDESLERFEVYYDSFSDRLVYPIYNLEGKIVNIGGRTLDPQWKDKKLRKYTYFFSWGGAMSVVYGLFQNLKYILEKKEVIIFEGCKSVMIADTWGIKNTAALLTSHLSPYQMKILIKLGCRVILALDKDVDIRQDKNIKKLKNYVNIDYIYDKQNLLKEKDAPVDEGKEVFEKLYKQKIHYR